MRDGPASGPERLGRCAVTWGSTLEDACLWALVAVGMGAAEEVSEAARVAAAGRLGAPRRRARFRGEFRTLSALVNLWPSYGKDPVMKIEAFFDEPTNTLTYLVWDPDTRDAVVIDPVLNFDALRWTTSTESVGEVLGRVREQNLRVHYVLETHAHADHLTGSQLLKRNLNAPVVIGERIKQVQSTFKAVFDLPEDFAVDGSQFDRLVSDGETLAAGALVIEVIATPGHTPACVSYKIRDAVFTGDSLFMDDYGTGRADFPNGSSAELYDSIHGRLYSLPDETRVFVGHDYLPEGRTLAYETTIGKSKKCNPILRAETRKEDFTRARDERDARLAPPRLIYQSLQVNANAGKLAPAHANGIRYLTIPLNRTRPTDDAGSPL